MKRLLFLCTGNYYRSRYAEIYFNWLLRQHGGVWQAESRGLRISGGNVGPISAHTAERLKAREITCESVERYPQDLTEEDLRSADHVVAVKRTEHYPLCTARFPKWVSKVEFWEVHDLDCATPDEAMPELERHVEELFQRLTGSVLKTSA